MKKLIIVAIFCLAGSVLYAAGPDLIWAGGGIKVSNESNPCYYADSFVLLSQLDSLSLFSQPMLTLRGGKPGIDLGVGGRQPIMNGLMIGGGNLFYRLYHQITPIRDSAPVIEIYHPNFSGHMNLYAPVSGEHGGEEALSGIDLTFGVTPPRCPLCLSVARNLLLRRKGQGEHERYVHNGPGASHQAALCQFRGEE